MATNPKQTVALIDLAVAGNQKNTTRVDASLRRLDGLTLLEWCIRRLSEATLVETIVVTGPPQYRELISNTGLCNARWMPSALSTPSQRAKEVSDRLNADWVVFASPLCPFTDPSLIDRLVSRGWANPTVDFVGFFSPKHPSFSLQALGLVGEMCSATAIDEIFRQPSFDKLNGLDVIACSDSNGIGFLVQRFPSKNRGYRMQD